MHPYLRLVSPLLARAWEIKFHIAAVGAIYLLDRFFPPNINLNSLFFFTVVAPRSLVFCIFKPCPLVLRE